MWVEEFYRGEKVGYLRPWEWALPLVRQADPVLTAYCSDEERPIQLRSCGNLLDIFLERSCTSQDLDIFMKRVTGNGCLVCHKLLSR